HVRCVVTHASAFRRINLQFPAQLCESSSFVFNPLDDVLHAQFAATHQNHLRAAPGNDGDLDSGTMEVLDAGTVAHVKHFEGFTPGPVIQPAIRQCAINVE